MNEQRPEGISMTRPATPEPSLYEAARTYAATGIILEIGTPDPALAAAARDTGATLLTVTGPATAVARTWRLPLRLLVLGDPDLAAARAGYDDWVHWLAGGGLLVIPEPATGESENSSRARKSGKFRELEPIGDLRVFQRTAACG